MTLRSLISHFQFSQVSPSVLQVVQAVPTFQPILYDWIFRTLLPSPNGPLLPHLRMLMESYPVWTLRPRCWNFLILWLGKWKLVMLVNTLTCSNYQVLILEFWWMIPRTVLLHFFGVFLYYSLSCDQCPGDYEGLLKIHWKNEVFGNNNNKSNVHLLWASWYLKGHNSKERSSAIEESPCFGGWQRWSTWFQGVTKVFRVLCQGWFCATFHYLVVTFPFH